LLFICICRKAMSAFVLPEASGEDTDESSEEEISDFDENGGDDDPSSTSSSPSTNQSSSASATVDNASDDEPIRRSNRPSFLPPFYKLLPPLGRVGFNSTDPKGIVMDFFKDELNYRASIGSKYPHPFCFFTPKSGLSEMSTFMERQKLLFSLNNFTAVSQNEITNYLPESVHCPKMVFLENQKRMKATRYHFNEERHLIYTGGYVKCLDWSPPYIEDTGDSLTCIPKYLAVASYPNNGTRVTLSDPIMKEFGLIHIWACSGLALTKEQSRPDVKPHFFLAHDWGYIMDLKWIPIPVQYAKVNPPPPLPYGPATGGDQPKPSSSVSPSLEFHPTQVDQLVGCVVGHLIAACTDGFVRILPIPCHDNRKRIAPGGKLVIPTSISADGVPQNIYKLKPSGVLLLAPGAGKEIPPWLGWPNLLAIRTGFPHYLMVAYTSGHLGIYTISTLDSFDLRIKDNLLRPTLLTHRQPGPFSSIALHPLRENYVIGLGKVVRSRNFFVI
uniref:General transcription factor 3C polypeptide 2 n=1 Tax=Rodentolepis nana TaxID=102285 RepID=A0A0R3T9M1_RODNA